MNIFGVLEVILNQFLALRTLTRPIPRLFIELFKDVEQLDALLRLPLLGNIFFPGLLLDVVGFIDWSRRPLSILIQFLLVVLFEALPIEKHIIKAPISMLVGGVFLVHHRHEGQLLELSILVDDSLIDAALVMHRLHPLHHVVLNEVVLGLVDQGFGGVQGVIVLFDRAE